jgi:flagellar motor switch protein FliG
MTLIVIGLSFIVIWLGTSLFIVRYIKKLRKELLYIFSDTKNPSENKRESISEEYEERVFIPFEFIKRVDPKHLLNYIWQEHPQVIALVLSYLEPGKASVILRNLPQELQGEVSRRIATMDWVSPEIVHEIERVLEKKLSTLSSEQNLAAGGVESITEILNLTGHGSKNQIIKDLEKEDPELAKAIKILRILKKPHRRIWRRIWGKSISSDFEEAMSHGRK